MTLFLLPTCNNVWALSSDHAFLENQSYLRDTQSPKENQVHPFNIFCGTQHTENSPYKDCCDSDTERLDISLPLRGDEIEPSSSKKAFIDVLTFHETIRDIHRVSSNNQISLPPVFDRQTYTNLIGIIKRLD